METVHIMNAVIAGMIIGWWLREIGRCLSGILERAAPAPRSSVSDHESAKPVTGDAPTLKPFSEPSPQPVDGDDYGDRG